MVKIYDLIIIGGGPAGMTAGIYATRQKLNTLLITKNFGGQMARKAVEIENYPGFEKIRGMDLIQKFEKHLRKQKIDIERDSVVKVKRINNNFSVLTAGRKRFRAKTVIVTSGADPRPLKVPGEKKFIGRGVSYCPVCDLPFFAEKEVAVIGGGNAGFEVALALTNYAKKIYILEFNHRVKADEENQELVKRTGKAKVITSVIVKKIRGKNFVDSIIYRERRSQKEKILKVQGVFVEIGSRPAASFVKDLVDFNEKNEIKINLKTNMTRTPGLFAAGDVSAIKEKQIVVAAGEGAKAGLSAYRYLLKYRGDNGLAGSTKRFGR